MRKHSLLCLFLIVGLPACSPSPDLDGEALARNYCASCHLFPEPHLLESSSWETVLPDMGYRLGIYDGVTRDSVIAAVEWHGVNPEQIYPNVKTLSIEEWEAIYSYFKSEAPDSIVMPPRDPPISVGLPGFRVRAPAFTFDRPLTTVVSIKEKSGRLILGNLARPSSLTGIDAGGELLFYFGINHPVVDVHECEELLYILTIGSGLEPTEAAEGGLHIIDVDAEELRTVITDLKRPVDMEFADLTGNGLQDIVVAEFGHETGYLTWHENLGDDTYQRHILSHEPGAVQTVIRDLNGNGLPDIAALTAQGAQTLDFFYNHGEGIFVRDRIFQFPPVYGSVYFELVDFNGNGRKDILYVSGDNADFSPILKDYHGIRIFLRAEDGSFSEEFFYHVNGATSARAVDFDGNGHMDIAAIAYFPDFAASPEESFVLLRNEGDFNFTPHTFEDSYRGRWLTMDVGDLTGNGRPDILLGSNIGFAPRGDTTGLLERWQRDSPSYILLENESEDDTESPNVSAPEGASPQETH